MNRNTAQRLGSWKITVALLAIVAIAGIADFHAWYYWTALGAYTTHIIYATVVGGSVPFWGRRSGWRHIDSRTTEGHRRAMFDSDERGPSLSKGAPCQCAGPGRCDGTCHLT